MSEYPPKKAQKLIPLGGYVKLDEETHAAFKEELDLFLRDVDPEATPAQVGAALIKLALDSPKALRNRVPGE